MPSQESTFLRFIGERLRANARLLAERWLDELARERPEPQDRIFPTATLLNSIPELLKRLADAFEGDDPGEFDTFVENEALDLARLRSEQGYSVDELVAEFDLLRGLVFEALEGEAASWSGAAPPNLVMSAARQLEEGLGALSQRTARALRELGRHDRDLRESLVAGFSRVLNHELRNRVGAAVLTTQLIRESSASEEADRLLDRLESSLRGLENLVSDAGVFTLSEFERPDWSDVQRRSLRAIVATVVDELAPAARAADVEVRVDERLPTVQVDRARIKLILANLLGNALKYSDPVKRPKWVAIQAHEEPERGRWEIEVEDNGIGIPKALQNSVFDDRVRAENAADQEGQGLGLALVREAVEQLGGDITLESQVGKGTRFAISCPLPRASR